MIRYLRCAAAFDHLSLQVTSNRGKTFYLLLEISYEVLHAIAALADDILFQSCLLSSYRLRLNNLALLEHLVCGLLVNLTLAFTNLILGR